MCPVYMNVYARFGEIPSMTLKDIKGKNATDRHMHACWFWLKYQFCQSADQKSIVPAAGDTDNARAVRYFKITSNFQISTTPKIFSWQLSSRHNMYCQFRFLPIPLHTDDL